MRPDFTVISIPGTALPSMSAAMASICMVSPARTNARSERSPTYTSAGCTSTLDLAVHA